jgi:hypothetical protein
MKHVVAKVHFGNHIDKRRIKGEMTCLQHLMVFKTLKFAKKKRNYSHHLASRTAI